MATASNNNSFIKNGALHILPTLTSSVYSSATVFDGHTLNLTGCTYDLTGTPIPPLTRQVQPQHSPE